MTDNKKTLKISIPGILMKFTASSDKEKTWLFISMLDLHFGKEKVDRELKKFETFIDKQRKPLKVKNMQLWKE